MLKHCVFLSLRPDADPADLNRAMQLLAGLVGQVSGMLDFAHGPNCDFEGLSKDHGHGFVITFSNRAAHLTYERNPDHVTAGGLLVAGCRGGIAGIFVADLLIDG